MKFQDFTTTGRVPEEKMQGNSIDGNALIEIQEVGGAGSGGGGGRKTCDKKGQHEK